MSLRFAITSILRELRGAKGRSLFVIACLSVGVAAVVGVASLASAFNDNLRGSARELLGADLRVASFRELPENLDEVLKPFDAERTLVREFGTMVSSQAGKSRLVRLKAVQSTFPLYGTIVTEPAVGLQQLLAPDAVVVAPELLLDIGVAVGDMISVGGAPFRIAGVVTQEPEVAFSAMVMGPRVFLAFDSLPRARLMGFGSRVRHIAQYKIPGGESAADRARDAVKGQVKDAVYLDVDVPGEGPRGTQRGVRQVARYLGLVALVSLLLGGVGVSQIIRTWLAMRMRTTAVLRCMGYRSRDVVLHYGGHVLLLAFVGSVLGGLAGVLAPVLLPKIAPGLALGELSPGFAGWALLRGVALGVFVALLFSVPILLHSARVPPVAVLRSDAVPVRLPIMARCVLGLVLVSGVFLAAWFQTRDLRIAISFALGLFVVASLLFGLSRGIAWLAGRLPRERTNPYLRHGIASLARPGGSTLGALVALGLGILVVTTVSLVERGLSETLMETLPKDTPTAFLVDVQPEQWEQVNALLMESGATSVRSLPLITARLVSVDGETVQAMLAEPENGRGRRRWVLTREQRMTVAATLPDDNVLLSGAPFTAGDEPEVSVEQGFARDMGCDVGSTLVFDIQGVEFSFKVSSIRKVQWESFQINFFLVAKPGFLDDVPQLRIATATMDREAEARVQDQIASIAPNVTIIRVRDAVERVSVLVDRLGLGVRILGGFTILTGLIILGGAIAGSAARRYREIALLKTLGVTRRGIVVMLVGEYLLVGLVAGLVGGAFAILAAGLFLNHVLEIPAGWAIGALPVVLLLAGFLTVVCGLLASWKPMGAPPAATLRG